MDAATGARDSRRGLFALAMLLLLGLFSVQLWFHATRTSATIDEAPHIFAGYRYWQCGDFSVNVEHPPLLKLLATIPLVHRDLVQPPWACGSKITSSDESYGAGNLLLAQNTPDSIVVPARLMASLMSLLLAVLVLICARRMFGRQEALVALALLAFEPNLVAHGSLVTTDMALTTTLFATVYAFYRYQRKPTARGLLWVGLATGATLAAKHSGILVLPILCLLLVVDFLLSRRREADTPSGRRIWQRMLALMAIGVFALGVLWASYGFQRDAVPNDSRPPLLVDSFFEGAPREALESPVVKTLVVATRIVPESYAAGLFYIMRDGSRPMFLLGQLHPSARWFYFPAAFLIKTSVALLLLLPLGLLAVPLYRSHRREMLFMLIPALAYFGICLMAGLNIGVRHILPVYPFFIVIAAAGAGFWTRRHAVAGYAVAALLMFHAGVTLRNAPNYLAFANTFWGGTNNTHRLLSDSNVEWGQNLKIVRNYVTREHIEDCYISTFGFGELTRAYQPCRLMPNDFGWNYSRQLVEPLPPVLIGTVFLSVAVLPPLGGPEYTAFLDTKPIAFLGGSTNAYRGRFEIPLLAALSYVGRAGQLTELGRIEEALADAGKAVALAPNDPRPHLMLGTALELNRKPAEAQRELETSIRLANANPSMVFEWTKYNAHKALARLQKAPPSD